VHCLPAERGASRQQKLRRRRPARSCRVRTSLDAMVTAHTVPPLPRPVEQCDDGLRLRRTKQAQNKGRHARVPQAFGYLSGPPSKLARIGMDACTAYRLEHFAYPCPLALLQDGAAHGTLPIAQVQGRVSQSPSFLRKHVGTDPT
jgi:hypothetical protein